MILEITEVKNTSRNRCLSTIFINMTNFLSLTLDIHCYIVLLIKYEFMRLANHCILFSLKIFKSIPALVESGLYIQLIIIFNFVLSSTL